MTVARSGMFRTDFLCLATKFLIFACGIASVSSISAKDPELIYGQKAVTLTTVYSDLKLLAKQKQLQHNSYLDLFTTKKPGDGSTDSPYSTISSSSLSQIYSSPASNATSSTSFQGYNITQTSSNLPSNESSNITSTNLEYIGSSTKPASTKPGYSSMLKHTTKPTTKSTTTSAPKCPDSWRQFNDSCWQLYEQPRVSWFSARIRCLDSGADLATITSQEENEFAAALQLNSTQRKELLTTTTAPAIVNCSVQNIDLILVVDGSGSIGIFNFLLVKNFLKVIVDEVNVDTGSQVAMVQFDNRVFTEFNLSQYHTKAEIKDAIDRVVYQHGKTNTGRALQHVLDFDLQAGNRPDFPDYVLVITDGQSDDDPRPAAVKLREKGVNLLAIGVTEWVNETQLLDIAGSNEGVFLVDDFSQLHNDLGKALERQICKSIAAAVPVSKSSWIGLEPMADVGHFRWAKDGVPITFESWENATDLSTTIDGQCGHLGDFSPQNWATSTCDELRSYICRRKL